MTPKQKLRFYSSMLLPVLVGAAFLYKGWQQKESILLLLGCLLVTLGAGRYVLLSKYVREAETQIQEDAPADDV